MGKLGHKRGPWGQMHGDVGLCCMSCDARMHVVANGTIESAVMRMGEELGCLTVFFSLLCWKRLLEHSHGSLRHPAN